MASEARTFVTCPVPFSERERILLGHGSGGKLTAELIERTLLPAFHNPMLAELEDQALLPMPDGTRLAFTTDSYVVTPIFFPDSDIGELAINGTVNDLAVGGAEPLALSLAFIIEEGLPMSDFERIVESARAASQRVGVPVVTGDTKVVGRGSADRIFVNTSGVGRVPKGVELGARRVRPGDAILISGTLGDHGIAIMLQREGLSLEADVVSDTAPLHDLVRTLLAACPDVHAMRDPTRGGVAATLVEVASRQRLGIEVDEARLPVCDAVRGACELLGFDPLHVANEGKLIAFVPESDVEAALSQLRAHPLGRHAARIGRVTETHPGLVILRTPIGGQRILDLPFTELLPRIC